MEKLRPGVFIDRDGVINKKGHYPSGDIRGYVLGWEQFVFYEDVMDAFFAMYEMQRYDVFVVSNQSGISRNLEYNGMPVNTRSIRKIFKQMEYEITEDVRDTILCNAAVPGFPQLPLPEHGALYQNRVIRQSIFCPHDDSFGCCCRKPAPGMIYYLAVKWRIDLNRSWVIGDSIKDMQAGDNAGIKRLIKIDRDAVAYDPESRYVESHWNRSSERQEVLLPNLYNAVEFVKGFDKWEDSIGKNN